MSHLVTEIVLRLLKPGGALLVGLVIYALLVGPLGAPSSPELLLLAWLSGAAFILLIETGPL